MTTRAIPRTRTAAALLVLLLASALLRTRSLDAGYWVDEGLAVGIAGHPLGDIPGLLRQDGSPPLYYMLLAVWAAMAGTSELATHSLSLIFALATIPAALWAGRALFGTRAGWASAALVATAPLLTEFAQQTRMYSLVALLSLIAVATFALGFVHGRRGHLVAFGVVAALLLYTHNWGLYLLLGLACALPVAVRRRGLRTVAGEALPVAAAVALVYAPWLPTLAYQAEHTGAPWSTIPGVGKLAAPLWVPLGEGVAALVAVAGAALGLGRIFRRPPSAAEAPAARASLGAIGVALVSAGLLAWVGSQLEPGWADRYLNVFTGPVVLLVGAGVAAAGRAGIAALAIAVLVWAQAAGPEPKSNAREVTDGTARTLGQGDLVVALHPEQVAVLRHYGGERLRFATALGPTPDPRLFDWREALPRLRAADPRSTLDGLLTQERPRRVVLVRPVAMTNNAPWVRTVRRRSAEWVAVADRHPRLRRVRAVPARARDVGMTPVQALVYTVKPRN